MNLCYEIASRLYRRKASRRREAGEQRGSDPETYWQWQYGTSGKYLAKFWDFTEALAGKSIVDIGCGIGGRTCYIASLGARAVTGIDINHREIDTARRLADELHSSRPGAEKVEFVKVKEDDTSALGPFDIAVLVDSLEHVKDPVGMLNLAYDMLVPGGICYFGSIGWYNHSASHLTGIVPIPFATLFFSDAQILDAVRRIVAAPWYRKTPWDTDPPVARWEGVTRLNDRPGEYLNRLTIAGMRHAMRQSRFVVGRLRVQGFSRLDRPVLRLVNLLARVPVIQEAYHSGCFGRLDKRI